MFLQIQVTKNLNNDRICKKVNEHHIRKASSSNMRFNNAVKGFWRIRDHKFENFIKLAKGKFDKFCLYRYSIYNGLFG